MLNAKEFLSPEVSATALLGLDGLRPVAVRHADGATEIAVEYFRCRTAQEQGAPCDGCQLHERREGNRRWTDTPRNGPVALKPVAIVLRRPAGDGSPAAAGCSGVPGVPATVIQRLQMTRVAMEWSLLRSMSAPFAEVGREMGCSDDKLRAIFAAILPAIEAWRPAELPERLGIDGVHTHDGTYTVIAGLPDRVKAKAATNGKARTGKGAKADDEPRGQVIEMLNTHQADKVKAELEQWPNRDRVKVVALDPSSTLRSVVRELFPQARLVVDRRHIQRRALKCAHAVRKRHAGAADADRSRKAPEAPAKKSLARAIDKRSAKLKAEDLALMDLAGPLVTAAYRAKERFYAIYDTCHSPSEAKAAVAAWWETLDVGLIDFFRPVYTLVADTWADEFLAYFAIMPRTTTAFVESCNRTLRAFEGDARHRASHARLRAQMLYRFGALSPDQLKVWLAAVF